MINMQTYPEREQHVVGELSLSIQETPLVATPPSVTTDPLPNLTNDA